MAAAAWGEYAFHWFAQVLVEFTAGALIYLAIRRIQWTPRRHTRALWTMGVVVPVMITALFLLPVSVSGEFEPRFTGVAVLITLLPIVIAAAGFTGLHRARHDYVSRFLSSRAIVHGGHISYSLYLVHAPVNGVFQRLYDVVPWPTWGPAQLLPMAALIVISLLVAQLPWCFIEEPARLRLRKLDPFRAKQPASDQIVG